MRIGLSNRNTFTLFQWPHLNGIFLGQNKPSPPSLCHRRLACLIDIHNRTDPAFLAIKKFSAAAATIIAEQRSSFGLGARHARTSKNKWERGRARTADNISISSTEPRKNVVARYFFLALLSFSAWPCLAVT